MATISAVISNRLFASEQRVCLPMAVRHYRNPEELDRCSTESMYVGRSRSKVS